VFLGGEPQARWLILSDAGALSPLPHQGRRPLSSDRPVLWKCRAVDAGGKPSSRVTGRSRLDIEFPPVAHRPWKSQTARFPHFHRTGDFLSLPHPNGSRPSGARANTDERRLRSAERTLIFGLIPHWNGPRLRRSMAAGPLRAAAGRPGRAYGSPPPEHPEKFSGRIAAPASQLRAGARPVRR
jgi:hypothetical protein